jgi:glycerate kinase
MKVVVAPDKFAGTLTAVEAAAGIADGWCLRRSGDHLDLVPMSDGGPGFVTALRAALGGDIALVDATGPQGAPVTAQILYVGEGTPTAYIEAADCCGLHLAPQVRRPLEATSDGLAVLLQRAAEHPVARVVVGIGGTASTDGGRGVVSRLKPWPRDIELIVATDVAHPLLGTTGAARSFGPQKGASASDVEKLEHRLLDWSRANDIDPQLAGAGAGGGLAYGLMSLGASRVNGAELVAKACGLAGKIGGADLVITGEGALDASSLSGKVIGLVGGLSLAAGRPCIAMAGRVEVSRSEAAAVGVSEFYSLTDWVGEPASTEQAADQLAALAGQVAAQRA